MRAYARRLMVAGSQGVTRFELQKPGFAVPDEPLGQPRGDATVERKIAIGRLEAQEVRRRLGLGNS